MRPKSYLFNPVFIFALVILVLNDHFFKYQFGNVWTGKLSDFAGMLVLPMCLAYCFPKYLKQVHIFTGIFFIFIKIPLSEPFIEWYNSLSSIGFVRVVDYTDLSALVLLPFSYWFMKNIDRLNNFQFKSLKISALYLLIPTGIALMATSPRRPLYSAYQGNFTCGNCKEKLKVDRTSFFEKLEANGLIVEVDSFTTDTTKNKVTNIKALSKEDYNFRFFKIEELIIGRDTLHQVHFKVNDSGQYIQVKFTGMQFPIDIYDYTLKRKVQKLYFKKIEKYFESIVEE